MEYKPQTVVCPNGHYYNPTVHSVCPTCGLAAVVNSFQATADPGPQGNFPPTERPGMGGAAPQGGSFTPTEDPHNAWIDPPPAGHMDITAGADVVGADGGAVVSAFGQQTMIGGDLVTSSAQVDPVVGWLVCIDGPTRGTDWRIHAGYNYIGREIGDIHIHGDLQISRKNHAMVAYHAQNHTYYVGPAEGRNIIEVNGEPVFNAIRLNSYDIITVGTTRLLFIGLCNERFSWDQMGKQEGRHG